MTIVITPDYDQVSNAVALNEYHRTTNAPLEYASTPDPAGVFETAGLMYQNETVIGSALTYGFAKDRTSQPTFMTGF